MQEKLKEEEISFLECLYSPDVLIENLVPLDESGVKPSNNPSKWDEEIPCVKVRTYQYLFLSYEYLIADDSRLVPEEVFALGVGVGTSYLFCGRKTGKSFIGLDCDNLCDILLNDNAEVCFSSFDHKHLRTRMEFVCRYVEDHPFFRMYHLTGRKKTVNRGSYWILTENGHQIYSINENIKGKNPGSDYHQVHYQKLMYEENSYETEAGYSKRIDSTSELGCIERLSGIPDFHKSSPAAKIFGDPEKLKYLVKLPEYVSPYWNEKTKKKRIVEYGGEGSAGYRVNILAEIIQGAYSGFDMERVRDNNNRNELPIKHFEISKDNYKTFKIDVVVDRLKNAELTFIAADIGYEAAPTEIIVIFKVKDKYLYRYNIILFGLIEEQYDILLWLFNKLKADYLGLDTTEPGARRLCISLEKVIPRTQLIRVHFTKKMVVGFEKDNEGNAVCDSKGDPLEKLEYVDDWSFQMLKELMYNNRFDLAIDQKVDLQFDGMIQTHSGNRVIYDNMTANHLLQAFQVFGIMQFLTEFQLKPKEKKRTLSLGVSSFDGGE